MLCARIENEHRGASSALFIHQLPSNESLSTAWKKVILKKKLVNVKSPFYAPVQRALLTKALCTRIQYNDRSPWNRDHCVLWVFKKPNMYTKESAQKTVLNQSASLQNSRKQKADVLAHTERALWCYWRSGPRCSEKKDGPKRTQRKLMSAYSRGTGDGRCLRHSRLAKNERRLSPSEVSAYDSFMIARKRSPYTGASASPCVWHATFVARHAIYY